MHESLIDFVIFYMFYLSVSYNFNLHKMIFITFNPEHFIFCNLSSHFFYIQLWCPIFFLLPKFSFYISY
ncbi:hypothetical protein Hdeb2414_s0002g00071441 [Helianthus debilis subsp. tardiflorus]